MPRLVSLLLPAVIATGLGACASDPEPGSVDSSLRAAPRLPALAVYRPPVTQGNVVTPDRLAALQPGMSRERVRAVLGTPMLEDPFHPERWDYVYSEREGYRVREQRRITLYFDGDRLDYIAGDVVPTPGARYRQLLAANTRTTINVPPAPPPPKGLLERVGRRIGVVEPPPPEGYGLSSYVRTDEAAQYGAVTGEPSDALGPPPGGPTFVPADEVRQSQADSEGSAPQSPAEAEAEREEAAQAAAAPGQEEPGLFDGLLDHIGL